MWLDPSLGKMKFSEAAARWLSAGIHKRASSLARDRIIIDRHLSGWVLASRLGDAVGHPEARHQVGREERALATAALHHAEGHLQLGCDH